MARNILRNTRDGLMILIKWVLFLVPKNNNLIVVNAWFGQKYADNTMYEFEYLLENTSFNVVWTTKNRKVFDKLKREGKPVVLSNTVKGIWTQIRAKMLLSTIQHHDFNKYFLCNCILLDLDHGIIYKQVGFDIHPDDTYQLVHDKVVKKYVKFYMTTTSYLTEKMMEHSYHVKEDNTFLCGKARLDYFFDKKLRTDNSSLKELIGDRKTIMYMPTHRSNGKKKINIEELIDLKYINDLCVKYGYLFIIKKHFYHRSENTKTDQYSNIIDVTGSTFDAQEMLFNADILITDYSSCYIDFLLLDRPLVLFTYDLEEYLENERELFVSFEDLDIGYQPLTKNQLNDALTDIVSQKKDKYKNKRKKAKSIYFDDSLDIGNSRKEICSIICQLMDGNFKTNWEKIAAREQSKPEVLKLSNKIKKCN